MYESFESDGDSLLIHFSHATGLHAKDNEAIRGFALYSEETGWVWADASIEAPRVRLSAPSVKAPVAARYSWGATPVGNLYNRAGLPAFPFRTDGQLSQRESANKQAIEKHAGRE